MEGAPLLRPVPARPTGPIAPADAVRYATGELPGLDQAAAQALALIVLAGRSREEVGGRVGLPPDELAGALARARKALRRKLHPLPGSGWCERAERLVSDRIDGALEEPGPARLSAHLTNCSRCVEHERRLAQAEDALGAGFADSLATKGPEREERHAVEEPPRVNVLHLVSPPMLPPPETGSHELPVPAAKAEPPAAAVVAPPVEVVTVPERAAGPPSAPAWPAAPAAPSSAPLPSPQRPRVPAPWHEERARPAGPTVASLEAGSTWAMVGPLVVLLAFAVVVVFALAAVLATGS